MYYTVLTMIRFVLKISRFRPSVWNGRRKKKRVRVVRCVRRASQICKICGFTHQANTEAAITGD